jgi:hypothetical protein
MDGIFIVSRYEFSIETNDSPGIWMLRNITSGYWRWILGIVSGDDL